MAPGKTRLLMTLGSLLSGAPALLGALGAVPQFAPWAVPLASLATFLLGAAHVSKPGDKAELAAAKAALVKTVENE